MAMISISFFSQGLFFPIQICPPPPYWSALHSKRLWERIKATDVLFHNSPDTSGFLSGLYLRVQIYREHSSDSSLSKQILF